jgi:hypothetical protein
LTDHICVYARVDTGSREEADRCPIRSPSNQLASTTSSQPLPLPQMHMQQAAPMPLTAVQTLGTCLIGGSMNQAGVMEFLERYASALPKAQQPQCTSWSPVGAVHANPWMVELRLSMSSASSSVEVNVEAKKMEMADLFQYKVCTTRPIPCDLFFPPTNNQPTNRSRAR